MPIPFADIERRLRLLGYITDEPADETIEMPEDYVGHPTMSQPRPVEMFAGEPVEAPMPPAPPVDSDLAGTPAYQRLQALLSEPGGQDPRTTTQPTGEPLSDAPVVADAVSGVGQVPPQEPPPAVDPAVVKAQQEAAAAEQRQAERTAAYDRYQGLSALQKARLNSRETKMAADSGLEYSMAQAQAEAQQERDKYAQAQDEVARQRQVQARMAAANEEYEAKKAAAMAQYQQSIEDMVAATPDPDALLGGRGSWGRAVVLALRANASTLGAPQVAALIDQNIQMELGRQNAKFTNAQTVVEARGGALKGLNEQQESASKAYKDQHAVLVEHMAKALEAAALRMGDKVQANKTMASAMALRVKQQGKEIGDTIELEGKLLPKVGGGSAPLPPVILPRGAWGAKNSVVSWGPEAEKSYQQYVSNETTSYQRAVAKHGAKSAVLRTATTQSPGGGATRVTTGGSKRSSAPAKVTAEANTPASTESSISESTTPVQKYKSDDHWYESNAPTTNREDQKKFYFIDGDHGNKAPPIEFATADDAKKFKADREMTMDFRLKLDKTRYLTEKLRRKGFFSHAADTSTGWAVRKGLMNDPEVQEAVAGLNKLKLKAKEIEKLGVLTGNDWEILGSVYGENPLSWQDPGPQFDKALEDLDDSHNALWMTYAPAAADNQAYNNYRNLPGAPDDWKARVDKRGNVDKLSAQEGGTETKTAESEGDNPSSEQRAARSTEAQRKSELQQVAYEDEVGPRGQLTLKPLPLDSDFNWKGSGDSGKKAFVKLDTGYIAGVADAQRYLKSRDPAVWSSYTKNRGRQEEAVVDLFRSNPKLMDRILPADVVKDLSKSQSRYRVAGGRGIPATDIYGGAVRYLKSKNLLNRTILELLKSGGV